MRLERTEIIVLANQKGGCGKTTAAVSLGASFAREGYSVCTVDIDPQCNTTDTFGVDRDELARAGLYTVADAYLTKKPATEIELSFGERFEERLTVIPGHRGLGSVPHLLDAQLQATVANDDYSELDADDFKNQEGKFEKYFSEEPVQSSKSEESEARKLIKFTGKQESPKFKVLIVQSPNSNGPVS